MLENVFKHLDVAMLHDKNKDADEHEIFFPFGYQDVPAVTLTLEGPNKIIVERSPEI